MYLGASLGPQFSVTVPFNRVCPAVPFLGINCFNVATLWDVSTATHAGTVIDVTARSTFSGAIATASSPPKAVASPSTPRASAQPHSPGQPSFFLKLPAGDPAAMASRVQKIMLQPIVRQRPSPFVWLHGPCLYRGGCLGQMCPVRCVARVGSDVLFSFIRPVILTVSVRCLPFCPVLCFVLPVAALFAVSLSTGTFSLDRSDPPLPPLPHARARTEPHLSFSADAAAGGGVAVRSDGYADARLHRRL